MWKQGWIVLVWTAQQSLATCSNTHWMIIHGCLGAGLIRNHLHVICIFFLEGTAMGRQHVNWPKLVSYRQSLLFWIINVAFLVITFEHILFVLCVRLNIVLIWNLVCNLILRVVFIGLVYLSLGVELLSLYDWFLITILRGKRLNMLLCILSWSQVHRSWQS